MKNKLWWWLLFLVILILIGPIVYVYYGAKEAFSKEETEIVVSRYMENLEWLKQDNLTGYTVTIYNKGSDDYFYRPEKSNVISLPNYGREAHTYLYHIIKKYDKLKKAIIFLPGSANSSIKIDRVNDMMDKMPSLKNSYYDCVKMDTSKGSDLYNFTIDNYKCSDPNNKKTCKDEIKKSEIRPFGSWYNSKIGDLSQNSCIGYNAIIAVTREDILKHPRSFYEKLLNELDKEENPETGHYMERSWGGIFGLSGENFGK